jgi:TolB-like protein
MASLVPGYEYDIFISYRQNDNRSGWVTEFIRNLQEELAAAIKEPVSVYFDANPHDGLLETHNVDKSLEGKLKCLIFIPILSQTYCDENSFAWKHEFLPFYKLASDDPYGIDIRLATRNIASRILPIQIHELDADDCLKIESVTGSKVRAIEFIYSSPGVNRPLTASDASDKNLKGASYRDHVNKTANAVKALLAGIRSPARKVSATALQPVTAMKRNRRKFAVVLLALVTIAATCVVTFSIIGREISGTLEDDLIHRSIAILPFEDISPAHDQAYLADGFVIEVMDHVTKFENLRVIPRSTMLAYRDAKKTVRQVGSELGVATLLEGSFRKVGDDIKITVSLVDTQNEQTRWQETYEVSAANIFAVQSEIAQQVAHSLRATITPEVQRRIELVPTKNAAAHNSYLKGRALLGKFWEQFNPSYIDSALLCFEKSVRLDSTFSNGYTGIGSAHWMLGHFSRTKRPGHFTQSKAYLNKAIALDPANGWAYSELGVVQHNYDWDRESALRSLLKARSLNPSDPVIFDHLGSFYYRICDCDALERTLTEAKTLFGDIEVVKNGDLYLFVCRQQWEQVRKVNERTMGKPADNPITKIMMLIVGGNYKEAIALGTAPNGEPLDLFIRYVGEAYALSGDIAAARNIIRTMEARAAKLNISLDGGTAPIWLAIGEEEKAYGILEKTLESSRESVHPLLAYSPVLMMRRKEPRMQEFIKRTWIPLKQN